jgi:hypothetical protein
MWMMVHHGKSYVHSDTGTEIHLNTAPKAQHEVVLFPRGQAEGAQILYQGAPEDAKRYFDMLGERLQVFNPTVF